MLKKIKLMKFPLLAICFLLLSFRPATPMEGPAAGRTFDLVVYGGTSSGVIAAYAAAKEGLKVALLEPGHHLGGLTSSGLGSVDIGEPTSVGGYAMEFFIRAGKYYGSEKPAFKIEPSVAEMIFRQMASEAGVHVFYGSRLVEEKGVVKKNGAIKKLVMENGKTFTGKFFIDATYEGDLMAWAKVPYIVGRESRQQYGESQAGVRPARSVKPTRQVLEDIKRQTDEFPLDYLYGEVGKEGEADGKTQSYTFRLTLTTKEGNKVPFSKPLHYNPARYEGLLKRILNNNITSLGKICTIYQLPNDKTDINHLDLINASHAYPDGSYALRDSLWQYHKDYEEGYLYFVATDPRVPEALRKDVARWGYAKDEFTDNHHWPRHLYIREGRRMIGSYVMRQQDSWEQATKEDGIGMGSYFLDSHSLQRTINKDGYLLVEGGLDHIPYKPYEIPYNSIIPRAEDCSNLFTTVCVSASHVMYTSLRMEPVYMVLGHAAGVAASLATRQRTSVQQVDVTALREKLQAQKQVLRLDLDLPQYKKFQPPSIDTTFHLYLLIGQSNMAGRGTLDTAGQEIQENILMLDRHNTWVPAKDPLHFDKKAAGTGPGLAFAKVMIAQRNGIKIGLIPCAVGGTSIGKWQPGAYDEKTNTHPYDDMMKRLQAALRHGVLKGILWHQGEGNSSAQSIRKYPEELQELVNRIRSAAHMGQVPFVAGELGYFGPTRFAFNEMIRTMPAVIPRMKVVSAEGLSHKGDNLHFDTPSARELGKRYAEAMLQLSSSK